MEEEQEETKLPEPEYFPRKWLWVTLIVCGIYAIVLVFLIIRSNVSKTPKVIPSPTPVISPSPSPVAVFNRKEIKINVLNGSGIAGYAGKAKDKLEALGYPEITVGNADAKDYTETKISIKKSKSIFLTDIKKDLTDYVLAQETGTVTEESEFDVEIILGHD